MLALFARFRCFFIIYYAPFARRCSVNCFSALTEIGCVSLARILCCRDNEKYRKPCKSNTKLCWASAPSLRRNKKRPLHVFTPRSLIIHFLFVVGRTRFSDLGQTGFTPTTKQQTNKTVPRGRFFRRHLALVQELSETIDGEALYTKYITSSG